MFLVSGQSDALDGTCGVEGVGYFWLGVAHVTYPRFCWNIHSDGLDYRPI